MATVFRYTSDGDSVLWKGYIQIPHSLTEIIDEADNWIPLIERKDVIVYFTFAGKQKFDRMLLGQFKKFMPDIELHTFDTKNLGHIEYKDEFVIACLKETQKK